MRKTSQVCYCHCLVSNRWNQTQVCQIKNKIRKSAGWLPEKGKDWITTSLSLHRNSLIVHAFTCRKYLIKVTNLIKQFFGLFSLHFKQYLYIIQHFLILFISLQNTIHFWFRIAWFHLCTFEQLHELQLPAHLAEVREVWICLIYFAVANSV